MKIVAVLHDVRSVHNVGSIFRTADAAAVSGIYLCGITPTPLDRFKNVRGDFKKVSLGAEGSVPWNYEKTAIAVLKQLRVDGYHIVAVEQSKKSVPYYAASMKKFSKIALVFGNEVKGLPPSILAMADNIAEIPMNGAKESLNVAVAFGVMVFGLRYLYT